MVLSWPVHDLNIRFPCSDSHHGYWHPYHNMTQGSVHGMRWFHCHHDGRAAAPILLCCGAVHEYKWCACAPQPRLVWGGTGKRMSSDVDGYNLQLIVRRRWDFTNLHGFSDDEIRRAFAIVCSGRASRSTEFEYLGALRCCAYRVRLTDFWLSSIRINRLSSFVGIPTKLQWSCKIECYRLILLERT